MDTLRHLHGYPDIRSVYKARIRFPVVIPLRLCPHGIRRVEKNVAVIIFLNAVHPPAQRVSLLAVEPHQPLNPVGRQGPLVSWMAGNGRKGTEPDSLGFKLGIAHGGIRGAQRGTRVPVLPAPVPFRSPVLPPEHNTLPRMRIGSQLFQSSEYHRRLLHLRRTRERNFIVLRAPVQLISQSPLFQANKTPPICPCPDAPVPKRQQGRDIHVFQPLSYSLIHRHFFSIQHIHSLHPVADENLLSLLDNGRNKIFRQHSGIRLSRNRGFPCGRTIQITVFLGIITPSHITPRTDAVTVRQPRTGTHQNLILIRTSQHIADIGRQAITIRLVRLTGELPVVPVPGGLNILPLHIP